MARLLLEHAKLQLLSTKFEKKMRAEGFDYRRKLCTAVAILSETMYYSSATKEFPFQPEYRLYGSTGEGIVYPLSNYHEKDMDAVLIHRYDVAVESVHDAVQYHTGNGIFLIENDHSLPGYCYLCKIMANPWYGLRNPISLMTSEIRGLQYLSSSKINNCIQNSMFDMPSQMFSSSQDFFGEAQVGPIGQQGPATNFRFRSKFSTVSYISKFEMVYLIRCPKWPLCASKWITRRRPYDWPTKTLITEIVAEGIYFAPVGCKVHQLRDLQWRYSFNEAERRLVRSFNSTQAKCYALLKRVISENVTPQFQEDVISSYHLKTLMFWSIEETDPQKWVPANLIQCVFCVLNRLVQCVEEGHCSSYFMPDENLFLHKVTEANKEELQACIDRIITEGWPVLTRLSNFATDHDFIQYIQHEYDTHRYALDEMLFDYIMPHNMLDGAETSMLQWNLVQSDVYKINESDRIFSNFHDVLNTLIHVANVCDDASFKKLTKNVIGLVCSSYGTHCLSLSRRPAVESSKTSEMEVLGEIYIELSCLRKQVECLAKHANYAYMRGNLQSTLSTADNIIRMRFNQPVYLLSTYAPLDVQIRSLLSCAFNSLAEADNLFETFVSIVTQISCGREVIFMKNEINAVPGNAKVDMFKVGHVSDPWNPLSRFRQCLVVDPYLYVAYLAFLAYSDMRLQEEADKAITTMEILCNAPPNSHLPASLNLLGDCYLKRGKVDKAMETFALSMQRNNRRNAAPWHVARLVWRKLLDRWLQTRDGDN